MSAGVFTESVTQLPDTIYVVTKKQGVHLRQQIAVESEQAARQWLEQQIGSDRAFQGELHWKEYNKTVVESSEGEVYGHVEAVNTLQE